MSDELTRISAGTQEVGRVQLLPVTNSSQWALVAVVAATLQTTPPNTHLWEDSVPDSARSAQLSLTPDLRRESSVEEEIDQWGRTAAEAYWTFEESLEGA